MQTAKKNLYKYASSETAINIRLHRKLNRKEKRNIPIPKHIDQKDTELQVSLTSPFHFRVKAEETEPSKRFFLQKSRDF